MLTDISEMSCQAVNSFREFGYWKEVDVKNTCCSDNLLTYRDLVHTLPALGQNLHRNLG